MFEQSTFSTSCSKLSKISTELLGGQYQVLTYMGTAFSPTARLLIWTPSLLLMNEVAVVEPSRCEIRAYEYNEERRTFEIQKLLSVITYEGISFVVGRVLKLLPARQNVGKFECAIQIHHSYTDRINSSFKVHFMVSVLTLGFSFIEEMRTLSV